MRKIYAVLFLTIVCFIVSDAYAQTSTYTEPIMYSTGNGNWDLDATWRDIRARNGSWSLSGTWSATSGSTTSLYTIPTSNAPDVVVILPGHVVTLKQTNTAYNGYLYVYGELIFDGKLTMDEYSRVIILEGGKLTSTNSESDKLSIGGANKVISAGEIDGVKSPNVLTADNLEQYGCNPTGTQQGVNNCNSRFSNPFPPGILPIELLYFNSSITNQGIQLDWASAKEWNFSHYTVERSVNGKEFTPIHTEYVNGDSYSTKTYSFLDMQPNFGANYYRLKATDIDATEEYKGIALAYSGMKGELQVYPNPAKGGLVTIKNPGAIEGTWLSVTATTGKELMRIQMAEQELRLPASVLPAGVYIVRVWNHLEVKQARLVIQ
jgi:hypothetical protein